MQNLPENGLMLMLAGSIVIVLIAVLGMVIHIMVYNGVTGEQEINFLQNLIMTLLPSIAIAYAGFHMSNDKKKDGTTK
jgi:hypothetical protein